MNRFLTILPTMASRCTTKQIWRILLLAMHLIPNSSRALSLEPEMNRRTALQRGVGSISSASFVASGIASEILITPAAHATPDSLAELPSMASAYQVFPDATPARNPKIKPVAVSVDDKCRHLTLPTLLAHANIGNICLPTPYR